MVSLMMQQLNEKHPNDYLIAMRVLWAPIGAMILFWVIVPESPWYHARRGNKEAALKSMKRLYGNIAEYDFEEEFGIITHTIEHENSMLDNKPQYRDLFKGVNKVRSVYSTEYKLTMSASNVHGNDSGSDYAILRSRYCSDICYL